jgi:hypothetical protein
MAPAANVAVPLPGTKVWIQDDSSNEWVKGEVKGEDGTMVVVSTAKGQRTVPASAAPLQNSDDGPVEVRLVLLVRKAFSDLACAASLPCNSFAQLAAPLAS